MVEPFNLSSKAAKLATTLTSLDGLSTSPATHGLKLASEEDLERIVEYGRKFVEMSNWSDLPFDERLAAQTALFMINDPDHVIILNDYGMVGGHVKKAYFSPTYVAQEMFWYAERHGQQLIKSFEVWAYARGADVIVMASLPMDERTDRVMDKLYKKRGYQPQEKFYSKKVID